MRVSFAGACFALVFACGAAQADESPRVVPPPTIDNPVAPGAPQTAVLAGGCYWGVQAMFERVKGVQGVVAGFVGQRSSQEDDLIRGNRAPAESVQITFDPGQISYGQLLQIYFSVVHDPTETDRQGPDEGPQYRSAIFYGDATQQRIAGAYIAQLNAAHAYQAQIVTRTERLSGFHKVANSQQDYSRKHPNLPYVINVDDPRIAAMKTLFPNRFRENPLTYTG